MYNIISIDEDYTKECIKLLEEEVIWNNAKEKEQSLV